MSARAGIPRVATPSGNSASDVWLFRNSSKLKYPRFTSSMEAT